MPTSPFQPDEVPYARCHTLEHYPDTVFRHLKLSCLEVPVSFVDEPKKGDV